MFRKRENTQSDLLFERQTRMTSLRHLLSLRRVYLKQVILWQQSIRISPYSNSIKYRVTTPYVLSGGISVQPLDWLLLAVM